jgi:hypothetical protein
LYVWRRKAQFVPVGSIAKHGGMMAIHAEDEEIVQFMTKKLQQEGNDQGYNLHLVHNNLSELHGVIERLKN